MEVIAIIFVFNHKFESIRYGSDLINFQVIHFSSGGKTGWFHAAAVGWIGNVRHKTYVIH